MKAIITVIGKDQVGIMYGVSGVLQRLGAVDIAGDQPVEILSVLLDQQGFAVFPVDDDHADGNIVHGKAEFPAPGTEGDNPLMLQFPVFQQGSANLAVAHRTALFSVGYGFLHIRT